MMCPCGGYCRTLCSSGRFYQQRDEVHAAAIQALMDVHRGVATVEQVRNRLAEYGERWLPHFQHAWAGARAVYMAIHSGGACDSSSQA